MTPPPPPTSPFTEDLKPEDVVEAVRSRSILPTPEAQLLALAQKAVWRIPWQFRIKKEQNPPINFYEAQGLVKEVYTGIAEALDVRPPEGPFRLPDTTPGENYPWTPALPTSILVLPWMVTVINALPPFGAQREITVTRRLNTRPNRAGLVSSLINEYVNQIQPWLSQRRGREISFTLSYFFKSQVGTKQTPKEPSTAWLPIQLPPVDGVVVGYVAWGPQAKDIADLFFLIPGQGRRPQAFRVDKKGARFVPYTKTLPPEVEQLDLPPGHLKYTGA